MISEEQVNEAARRLRVVLEKMLNPEPTKLPDSLKICTSCGQLKSVESFYRFHRSRDGRLSRCKSCFLTRREELKRERDGGGKVKGSSAATPVSSIEELRAALKRPEVFHT